MWREEGLFKAKAVNKVGAERATPEEEKIEREREREREREKFMDNQIDD